MKEIKRMQNYNMEEKNEYIPKELKATKGKKYNATLIQSLRMNIY